MKKDSIRALAAAGILLAVYHLIVFLIPFDQETNFWIAYLFSLVGFGVVGYALYISMFKSASIKSRFYGFPILRIGLIYGAVQLVLGFVFMILGELLPYELVLIVEVVVLAAALLGLIATETMKDTIEQQDTKLKKQVTMMRALYSRVSQMTGFCQDPEAAAALKALTEEFRYADPVSNPSTARAEADLVSLTDTLQQAVTDNDADAVKELCRRATVVLAERNRLCKLNKQ